MSSSRHCLLPLASFATVVFASSLPASDTAITKDDAGAAKVSYYKQVRPIFQANCQGCHQPAKASGGFEMTTFARMLAGGESGEAAVVPGKPDESHLIELITPHDGKADMPLGRKPLAETEIDLVNRWIAEGAVDDTPAGAKQRFDVDHPPVYTRQPVITSIDFSPDGQLLAVSGFHEVLLVKPESGELVARLVGMSERLESVRFSPDGKRLAVAGGLPARMGEVQVWDIENRKLRLSIPVTYDTVYGANWSPDGKLVSVGCSDNTVRAFDAEKGEQMLFQGAHTDWVRDTVFSKDGSHLVSVGRDMTTKLTELATQRFIDNVTSITPGALKGGILSVARHPERDEIVVGGSDSVVKVYRMFRLSNRAIGDDGNLIRQMPPLHGRIFSVAVSRDGKRIAAGSSLDGSGEVAVYSYEFDTSLPENIKQINQKVVTTRTAEENKALEEYHSNGVKQIAKIDIKQAAVYAIAFRPDGQTVAAAGSDGVVRLISAADRAVIKEFSPAPVGPGGAPVVQAAPPAESAARTALTTTPDNGQARPPAPRVDFIRDVSPVLSRLGCNQGTCHGAAQGKNGFKLSLRGYDPLFDVRALTDDLASRRVNLASPDDSMMLLKPTGAVPHVGGQVIKPGEPYYELIRAWIVGGAKLDVTTPRVVKIEVFPQNPTLEKISSKQRMRVMALYDDGGTREVTNEAFIDSGNTEVATAERGGMFTAVRRGEAAILARYEGSYAATTLTVMGDRSGFAWQQPPVWNKVDEFAAAKWQRMKIRPSELCSDAEFIRRVDLDLTGLPPSADDVRAFVADTRDTRAKRDALIDKLIGDDAFIDYWTNKWADLLQVNRKFLAPEGAGAFRQWIRGEVAANTPYDQFVRKILTSTGSNKDNPPASYYKILREPAATMENTTHLFLGVRFNCNKCHDHPFERWTQDQYYQTAAFFAQYSLAEDPASGGRKIGGTAVEGAKPLYELVSDKTEGEVVHDRTKQVTVPKFPFGLISRVNANPDSSFDRKPEASASGGTAGSGSALASGLRLNEQVAASTPATSEAPVSRRDRFAAWITSADNQYFARSYVNRLWGYLFGVGIIEPIDDVRAGNPATNPELLSYLTDEFIRSGFNPRHVMLLICKSRTYQLSLETNEWNRDDKLNYSHATARRLPAEVLFDAVHSVTGAQSKFPGVPAGTRAAALPDSGVELPSGFLATFGRPARESACECERSSGLQLGPVMALISGPTIAEAIAEPNNALTKLVAAEPDDRKLVNEIFLRVLNRPATDAETNVTLDTMPAVDADHAKLIAALQQKEAEWAPIYDRKQKDREAAIEQAKRALAEYEEKEYKPRREQQEKDRQERLAKAQTEFAQYEQTLLPKLAEWEKQQTPGVAWTLVEPRDLKANTGVKLTKEPDGSIIAERKDGPSIYTVTAETNLAGITGVQLEALADDRLPARGPGLADNGNFVVTELELKANPKGKPDERKDVKLENAQADFSQANYDVKTAIDGQKPAVNNGWAVSDKTGVSHWAVFEVKEPISIEGTAVLAFTLDQRYNDGKHSLGKFRLWVTTAAKPLALGLPAEVSSLLAVAADQRTPEQRSKLIVAFAAKDDEWRKRSVAVAEATKPLPPDPKLADLTKAIDVASQPLPIDPKLVQLRQDAEMSTQQQANKRLTVAQDLAWALINSPAFLFNH